MNTHTQQTSFRHNYNDDKMVDTKDSESDIINIEDSDEFDDDLTDINDEDYDSDDSLNDFIVNSSEEEEEDDDEYIHDEYSSSGDGEIDDDDDEFIPEDDYDDEVDSISDVDSTHDEKESKNAMIELNEGVMSTNNMFESYKRRQKNKKDGSLYMQYASMIERIFQYLFMEQKIHCKIIDARIYDANSPCIMLSCQYNSRQYIYSICLHKNITKHDLKAYNILTDQKDKKALADLSSSFLNRHIEIRPRNTDIVLNSIQEMISHTTNLVINKMTRQFKNNTAMST